MEETADPLSEQLFSRQFVGCKCRSNVGMLGCIRVGKHGVPTGNTADSLHQNRTDTESFDSVEDLDVQMLRNARLAEEARRVLEAADKCLPWQVFDQNREDMVQ